MPKGIPNKPRRERSAAEMTSAQAETAGIQGGDPRDPNREVRGKRVSMQQAQNLDIVGVPLDQENYYYRWFAEHPSRGGRVQRAQAAYYEHVTDEAGNPIKRPSGDGELFLMRLPIEYWQEDQEMKREKVRRTLMDQASLKGNEYAPTKQGREGGSSSIVDRKESDNPYA